MHRITVYQKSFGIIQIFFVHTFVHEWNALSTDVHESDSVRILKEKMHVFVKNQNVLTCRIRPIIFIWDRYLDIFHTILPHNCA